METKTTPYMVKQIRGGKFPLVQVVGPTLDEGVWASQLTNEQLADHLNAAHDAAFQSLAAENALLAEQVERLMVETERMRDALYELADAVLWSLDDADYKAPEQFTKSYVFGRYLNRMAQIARAAKELHPMPSPL